MGPLVYLPRILTVKWKGRDLISIWMFPMAPRIERICGMEEEKSLKHVDLESSLWKILLIIKPIKLWDKDSVLMVH